MRRVLYINMLIMALLVSAVPAYTTPPASAEWTLAVFMNADNDLDEFGPKDQLEMAEVGSNEYINIITLLDTARGPAYIDRIDKGKITRLKDLGEIDMGDYRQLIKFAEFVKANYPARKYIFTIWNHGSGWKKEGAQAAYRGISYDDSSGSHITNEQLGIAVSRISEILGQRIDILNMDACLMQMAEVNFVLMGHVDYVVASQENEPGGGAPYDTILKSLTNRMSPAEAAKLWVKSFVESYTENEYQSGDYATQSAIDLSRFASLLRAMDGLAKALVAERNVEPLKEALLEVQSFAYPENIDLLHLVQLLKAKMPKSAAVQAASENLEKVFHEVVIANANTGGGLKDANGLAVYFPYDFEVEEAYRETAFAKKTLWLRMIDSIAAKDKVNTVVSDIKEGELDSLKESAEKSETDKNNPFYRALISELNFLAYTEGSVPDSVKEEFGRLFKQIKHNLLQAN